MSRESLVFFLGIVVILLPYLGVSQIWHNSLLVAIGAVLVVLGYTLRRTRYYTELRRERREHGNDTFTESNPRQGEDTE